jgi:putative restriction endonuclease
MIVIGMSPPAAPETMGSDPNSPDNRWLRDAMEQQIPIVYFLGTSPGRYQPIIPIFIVGWHPERLRVQLAFGAMVGPSANATLPAAPERRYALREIKARLHQASFRAAVLAAYGGRCAISRLPEPRLLDAAHIVMDADEELGQPIISNGLPLTKIHHAAFDAAPLGSDPEFWHAPLEPESLVASLPCAGREHRRCSRYSASLGPTWTVEADFAVENGGNAGGG